MQPNLTRMTPPDLKESQSNKNLYALSLGLSLGAGVGAALGVALKNIALGVAIGAAIGGGLGTAFMYGKKK
jgi:hypothetical protein